MLICKCCEKGVFLFDYVVRIILIDSTIFLFIFNHKVFFILVEYISNMDACIAFLFFKKEVYYYLVSD